MIPLNLLHLKYAPIIAKHAVVSTKMIIWLELKLFLILSSGTAAHRILFVSNFMAVLAFPGCRCYLTLNSDPLSRKNESHTLEICIHSPRDTCTGHCKQEPRISSHCQRCVNRFAPEACDAHNAPKYICLLQINT